MSLVSTNLSGDAYLNYLFSGLVEIPAYIFSPILMNQIGRKKTVIVTHFFTAAVLFPLIFIPLEYKIAYMVFWLLGKLGISVCFISLFVYGAEIFPTIVRNTCMGTASFFGNIGGMLSFQTQYLAQINPVLPVAFYSFISFAGGLITFAFPETHQHRHIN
uniref:Major facilitator superfamily (MFS) profile domain-containing protein n=1 Tax=Panagrolaimus sp. PS1159 TaxID=55785 RepID=A0AC35F2N7_9BILA